MNINDSEQSVSEVHPEAPLNLITEEAATDNRWAPNVAREARGRLGAMAFHETMLMDEIRRLLPAELNATTGVTLGLRLQNSVCVCVPIIVKRGLESDK